MLELLASDICVWFPFFRPASTAERLNLVDVLQTSLYLFSALASEPPDSVAEFVVTACVFQRGKKTEGLTSDVFSRRPRDTATACEFTLLHHSGRSFDLLPTYTPKPPDGISIIIGSAGIVERGKVAVSFSSYIFMGRPLHLFILTATAEVLAVIDAADRVIDLFPTDTAESPDRIPVLSCPPRVIKSSEIAEGLAGNVSALFFSAVADFYSNRRFLYCLLFFA